MPYNVLFIMSDDQGAWAMHCAGNDEIITPNLDRLAAEGVRLENMFCVSPVCSPARASVLTGTIPSVHGVHDWLRGGNYDGSRHPEAPSSETAIPYLDGLSGYTDILADAGYTCAISGKWHMGDSETPQHGFDSDYWYTLTGGGCAYYHPPFFENGRIVDKNRYVTDVITDKAIDFLDDLAGKDSPFYLAVTYTAPHSPWDYNQHPKEIEDLYKDCPFESVPDLPRHPWQIASAPLPDSPERRRELVAGYYSAITAMDRGIGRLLDRLDALGLTDNTLVVFSGDNGMNIGHHGIWGKGNGTFPQNMYEESVKVPFIMRLPGVLPDKTVNTHIMSHYDFYPTLLDILGLPVKSVQPLPGHSRVAELKDPSVPDSGEAVVFDEYGPVRMIRTPGWKYVHRNPYGPHELYDMTSDPGETSNLSGNPDYAAIESELRSRLVNWFAKYADPYRDASRQPVYGEGQMNRTDFMHTEEMKNPV